MDAQQTTAPDFLINDAERVTGWLSSYFSAQHVHATRLADAMRYSALNGGKRMRAALVCASARLVSAHQRVRCDDEVVLGVAGAVEMLHAYSLIHDDLPAMDDAELRRGQPSAHIAFDEATAILAGDALQTEAFLVLSSLGPQISSDQKSELVRLLARASGRDGMAGGQMLDLQAENMTFGYDDIRQMQKLKTGALIVASCQMGAVAAGADKQMFDMLTQYAECLGFAFQIADDLLDVRADAGQLGKPAGRDAEQNKASLVTLMGMEQAEQTASELAMTAEQLLRPYGALGRELASLAHYTVYRRL